MHKFSPWGTAKYFQLRKAGASCPVPATTCQLVSHHSLTYRPGHCAAAPGVSQVCTKALMLVSPLEQDFEFSPMLLAHSRHFWDKWVDGCLCRLSPATSSPGSLILNASYTRALCARLPSPLTSTPAYSRPQNPNGKLLCALWNSLSLGAGGDSEALGRLLF